MILDSFLSTRQQFVKFQKPMSDIQLVVYGFSRDSVLGPLLFLIHINGCNNYADINVTSVFTAHNFANVEIRRLETISLASR